MTQNSFHATRPGFPGVALRLQLACFLAMVPAMLSPLHAAETGRTFSNPERIRYDDRCFTIDGRDVFLFSGAFHYFRCPKPLWRDRFEKIKEAGFNCVETYVPWNWHEREMPANTDDFSTADLAEFNDWLKMAEDFGFYTIVRPGPYICAEWDTGGFPQWLLTKKPADRNGAWLRGDEATFLAWSQHWYHEVCPIIASHQITRKPHGQPGVILVQIENEYDFAGFPDAVKIHHLKTLAEAARADGIDVPLMTCWTKQVRGSTDPVLRQVFDTCNFYPRWDVAGELGKQIPKLRAEQPDAPLMTAELQGGWFSQVGGKLSEEQDGVDAAQIQNLTLFAIQNGETALNYYMLFGGSNPGDWAARNLTTSYDYNAPIREWGGVGDRYQRVRAIGKMLEEHGARLARSELVTCEVQASQNDVTVAMRRAADGARYLFVRTSEHTEPREGTVRVTDDSSGRKEQIGFKYKLEPFGSAVLYLPPGVTDAAQGEWLPKPAPAIERPTDLPAPVTITSARRHSDPGPSHWKPMPPGERLAQAGIYDSGFLFYRAKGGAGGDRTNLLVEFPAGDDVVAQTRRAAAPRIAEANGSALFTVGRSRSAELLYENHGHANFGVADENPCGIASAQFVSGTSIGGEPIAGWRMHEVNGTSDRPEVKPGFDDANWASVTVDKLEADQLAPNHTAVFRAKLDVSESDLKRGGWQLHFGRLDDRGWIFVNGKQVGETTDWSRGYSFDVQKELRAGENVIAVVVQNGDSAGGLGDPALARFTEKHPASIEFGRPTGVEAGWWKPEFKDKRWKTVKLGAAAPSSDSAMLTWYRMNFSVQSPKPGVWVPWKLHLNATGNGFIYLNGHELGRYWEAGPQHDFFLPECWLNFGDGKTNQLTLSLRRADKGAEIQSAIVEPYRDFAEKR